MAASNSGFQLYNSTNTNNSSGVGGSSMSNSSNGSLIPAVGGNYSPSNNYDRIAAGILNNSNNLLLDSSLIPGLKHDTGLAVEWSIDEQYKLEQGLVKYANEPNIMRYIKIAASLQDKTVRDVALRCIWLARKRKKPEDQSSGKKVKDCKEKLMESTLKNTISSVSSVHVPGYSLTKNLQHPGDYMLSGVVSGGTARHLLEENNKAFGQISANLSSLKLQENIDLFSRTRSNITTILNDMRNMPGIMSRMPPLPVLLNEDLASSIFLYSSQPMMFGSSSSVPMK